MALEGQLSDFNLAEILQLIASQQKSGFLNLEAKRAMVFVFDKGILIATRDRRSRSRDPLMSYLMAYGFFSEEQWKHIEYVSENSTLDLTEILVSENLLTQEELERALKGLAQESVHNGMKLRRGRYGFNPTKGTPAGVRSRLALDVQGLLMEAARRLDEETQLAQSFNSQAITFAQGEKVINPDQMTPTQRHIMQLAVAGIPLGRIIRRGKTESFVVRSLLKTWCVEKYLIQQLTNEKDPSADNTGGKKKFSFSPGIKSLPLVVLLTVLLMGIGYLRWFSPTQTAEFTGTELRQSQLLSEVGQAATLFRYQKGNWPTSLEELVRDGQLSTTTLATLNDLGWKYTLHTGQDRYSLGS